MLVSDFNYDLPDERIAKFPPKERGSTRLLVLDKKLVLPKIHTTRILMTF